ncbi:hypothetical protein [Psychromonas sp. MME2]|uniref:hypothetical protein n=1 Tax=unclassified Psychromonas TaxID=2614957 RepID=UPI00339BA1F7
MLSSVKRLGQKSAQWNTSPFVQLLKVVKRKRIQQIAAHVQIATSFTTKPGSASKNSRQVKQG